MATGVWEGKCPTGVWGGKYPPSPTFCQDGARDFFKVDEKMIWGGVVGNLHRNRGRGQNVFIYVSHFYNLGHTSGNRRLKLVEVKKHLRNISRLSFK